MGKRAMLWLIALIPTASVCMGILIFVLASSSQNDLVHTPDKPLSKTSWREQSP